MPTPRAPTHDIIAGNYRLERVIGQGDVVTVHEASHRLLPRRAAVKVLRRELAGNTPAAQRVLREGCVLDTFAHGGVPRVLDCGVTTDGRPWLALELVGGDSLAAHLARRGALPVDDVIDLATGLLDVISAAHRLGLVHRALGPSRVIVGGGGAAGVRVLGWGLARAGGGGELAVDRHADVYAIGAMLYQAVTGASPFVSVPPVARVIRQFHSSPPPVARVRPELPADVAALVDAMVDADVRKRPTAADAALAFARLVDHYDELEVVVADGTDPGGPGPAGRPPRAKTMTAGGRARTVVEREPRSPSDRDWEALMALDFMRRPRTGARSDARMDRADDHGPAREP